MDLAEEIERSFGDGPPHRPVEERITAGRRLVVRRRIAMGACAAATVLVVGGTAWALAPDPTSSTEPGPDRIATQPTKDVRDDDQKSDSSTGLGALDPQFLLGKRGLATYGPDGELVIRKGWQVSQRIPNPYRFLPPDKSVGLELTNGTKTYWYLLDLQGRLPGSVSFPAGSSVYPTLEEWVADEVAAQQNAQPPSPVEFVPGTAELTAVDGATIVRQQPDPHVPGFARAGDITAVAEVRWKGQPYFVLARQIADANPNYLPLEYVPVPTSVPEQPTLESFLDYARGQYESGEGLR